MHPIEKCHTVVFAQRVMVDLENHKMVHATTEQRRGTDDVNSSCQADMQIELLLNIWISSLGMQQLTQ